MDGGNKNGPKKKNKIIARREPPQQVKKYCHATRRKVSGFDGGTGVLDVPVCGREKEVGRGGPPAGKEGEERATSGARPGGENVTGTMKKKLPMGEMERLKGETGGGRGRPPGKEEEKKNEKEHRQLNQSANSKERLNPYGCPRKKKGPMGPIRKGGET